MRPAPRTGNNGLDHVLELRVHLTPDSLVVGLHGHEGGRRLLALGESSCDVVGLFVWDAEAFCELGGQEELRQDRNGNSSCEALAAPRKLREPNSTDHIVECLGIEPHNGGSRRRIHCTQ